MSWSKQPKPEPGTSEINWHHPLARNLTGCWLCHEGGHTTLRDYARVVDNMDATIQATPATWSVSPGGRAWAPDGTDEYATSSAVLSDIITASAGTMAVRFWHSTNFDAGGGSPWTDSNLIMDAVGYAGIACDRPSATNDYQFWNFDGTTDAIRVASGGLNRWESLCWCHGGGTLTAYIDGKLPAAAIASGNTQVLTGALRFGADDTPDQFLEGRIDYIMTWKRELKAAEVMWLHVEPFTMFRPVRRRRYFVAAAAPSTVTGLHYYRRRVVNLQ